MVLSTAVALPKYPFQISHAQSGLILGSCFAQHIGSKISEALFPVTVNPRGVLFNPASIARAYNEITGGRKYKLEDLVFDGTLWHSMQHHGSFSASTADEVLRKINCEVPTSYQYIIVTLGTAWVYRYRGEIVANCHKIPSAEFERRRLTVAQCVDALRPLALSGARVILTVSPVRHVKDGLSENCLSKSILRLAVAELTEQYDNVHYFPSYEILMDELRDYRYYADDMIHPSVVAVDYIWERFEQAFFNSQTCQLVQRALRITRALDHRPLHGQSDSYLKFREETLGKLRELEKQINEMTQV